MCLFYADSPQAIEGYNRDLQDSQKIEKKVVTLYSRSKFVVRTLLMFSDQYPQPMPATGVLKDVEDWRISIRQLAAKLQAKLLAELKVSSISISKLCETKNHIVQAWHDPASTTYKSLSKIDGQIPTGDHLDLFPIESPPKARARKSKASAQGTV